MDWIIDAPQLDSIKEGIYKFCQIGPQKELFEKQNNNYYCKQIPPNIGDSPNSYQNLAHMLVANPVKSK